MSLEELLHRGRIDRWKELRQKPEGDRYFGRDSRDDKFKDLFLSAPEGSIVFAGEEINSYSGYLESNPDVKVYVEGTDAEFRIIAALKSLRDRVHG